jgi:2,5-diamino-6-(ribosylamino)-4(3H)-pyrimidinone 5'-phosphate reductase
LEGQPRPIIIDPSARWDAGASECLRLAKEGKGKGPWIVTSKSEHDLSADRKRVLEDCGGRYIHMQATDKELQWSDIMQELVRLGIKSIMVEGGGKVINTLLQEKYFNLIDSIIITIAPVWLGDGGVLINPSRRTTEQGQPIPVARLDQVKWKQFGDDVVLCGSIKR